MQAKTSALTALSPSRPLAPLVARLQQRSSLVLLFLFIFTLLTHTVVVTTIGGMASSDYTRAYLPTATALANGVALAELPPEVALRYPIGFPLFIAAHIKPAEQLGVTTEVAIASTQIGLAGATTVLLWLLARQMVDLFSATLAGLLWAVYPRVLWFTRHPNSEVVFTFLLYAAILCLALTIQRRLLWLAALTGVLVGLCGLVRPIAIGLGLVFVLILALQSSIPKQERILFIGVMLLLNSVVWTPWESYLWIRTGEMQPLAVNDATSVYDGITWALQSDDPGALSSIPPDVYQLMQRAAAQKSELVQRTSATGAFLLEEIQEHPLTVLKLLGIKIVRGLYANQSMEGESWNLLVQLPVVLLSIWGLRGAWNDPRMRPYAMMVLLLVLYFWAMTTLVLSISRYMIPITGLLFILIAYRIVRLVERFVTTRSKLPSPLTSDR
jgi:hypothetical protein